jgi:hypothetical protein
VGRAYSCPGRLGQEPRHIKAFLGRLPTGPKTGIRKEGILSLSNDPEIDPGGPKAVHQIDPNTPLEEPVTQQAEFEMSYSQPAMFARLAGFFGALAALLVATGLYGTLAYRTHRRTTEIGMRMALGAQRAQVIWMIMRESLLIVRWAFWLDFRSHSPVLGTSIRCCIRSLTLTRSASYSPYAQSR